MACWTSAKWFFLPWTNNKYWKWIDFFPILSSDCFLISFFLPFTVIMSLSLTPQFGNWYFFHSTAWRFNKHKIYFWWLKMRFVDLGVGFTSQYPRTVPFFHSHNSAQIVDKLYFNDFFRSWRCSVFISCAMIQFADGIDSIGHGYCFSIHFWNVWFLIFSIFASLSIGDVIIKCQQLNFNYTEFVPSIQSFSVCIDGLHVTRFVCLLYTSIFWQRNPSSRNNLISSYINNTVAFFVKCYLLRLAQTWKKGGNETSLKIVMIDGNSFVFTHGLLLLLRRVCSPTSAKRDSYAFSSSPECVD